VFQDILRADPSLSAIIFLQVRFGLDHSQVLDARSPARISEASRFPERDRWRVVDVDIRRENIMPAEAAAMFFYVIDGHLAKPPSAMNGANVELVDAVVDAGVLVRQKPAGS
jgi:hypothetical protein